MNETQKQTIMEYVDRLTEAVLSAGEVRGREHPVHRYWASRGGEVRSELKGYLDALVRDEGKERS